MSEETLIQRSQKRVSTAFTICFRLHREVGKNRLAEQCSLPRTHCHLPKKELSYQSDYVQKIIVQNASTVKKGAKLR